MNKQSTEGFFSIVENERGNLALEQVVFIGAIVAMGVGLYAFYSDLSTYFTTFQPRVLDARGVGPTSLTTTP